MIKSSTFFIMFSDATTRLSDVAHALGAAVPIRLTATNTVSVETDGVALEIGLSEGPHVLEEARELANRLGNAALSKLDRRLEVHVEDLGTALEEFNTLALVQQTLLELTNGIAWLQWNDALLAP